MSSALKLNVSDIGSCYCSCSCSSSLKSSFSSSSDLISSSWFAESWSWLSLELESGQGALQ
jgi:hypothetical protein